MVSPINLTANYDHSFTFDDTEADIKAIFIAVFNEIFKEKIQDIHHYGMPHLGSPIVVERFSKQDGLAVIRRPQSSDLIMRVIYANWRSLASKRGLAFLEFILQMLWANQWQIVRLYHSIARKDEYPKHVVETDLPENFLTSRIFVLLDANIDVNELRQLTPTLQRLVPANILPTVGVRMQIKDSKMYVASAMKPYMVARFF